MSVLRELGRRFSRGQQPDSPAAHEDFRFPPTVNARGVLLYLLGLTSLNEQQASSIARTITEQNGRVRPFGEIVDEVMQGTYFAKDGVLGRVALLSPEPDPKKALTTSQPYQPIIGELEQMVSEGSAVKSESNDGTISYESGNRTRIARETVRTNFSMIQWTGPDELAIVVNGAPPRFALRTPPPATTPIHAAV